MITKNAKKTILITGASSGLGQALAVEYAKLGYRLIISGRSKDRLDAVTKECLRYTSEVFPKIIDVTNKPQMHDWVKEVAAQFPIDIVIANAGISAGTLGGAEATEQVYQIFDTNLYGVLNTILPAIEVMLAQQSGQIVLISSIAGILPMASAPSYSTTKSALKTLGDTLRVDLAKYGINVNIVIPGFIKTPLTDKNDFPMPFIKSSTEAAEIIITGIKQNKPYIYFPKAMFYLAKFISIFPRPLLDYIMKKLPAKRALQEKILN